MTNRHTATKKSDSTEQSESDSRDSPTRTVADSTPAVGRERDLPRAKGHNQDLQRGIGIDRMARQDQKRRERTLGPLTVHRLEEQGVLDPNPSGFRKKAKDLASRIASSDADSSDGDSAAATTEQDEETATVQRSVDTKSTIVVQRAHSHRNRSKNKNKSPISGGISKPKSSSGIGRPRKTGRGHKPNSRLTGLRPGFELRGRNRQGKWINPQSVHALFKDIGLGKTESAKGWHAEDYVIETIKQNLHFANPNDTKQITVELSKSPCTTEQRGGYPPTLENPRVKSQGCTESLLELKNEMPLTDNDGNKYDIKLHLDIHELYATRSTTKTGEPTEKALIQARASKEALEALAGGNITYSVRNWWPLNSSSG